MGVRHSMGVVKGLFLVLVLQAVSLRGEDEVMEDEEVIEKSDGKDVEMDWAQMFQMGMALGKSILGEEAIEKLKQGDLSELIKVGEKVLGENTVKDFLNSATEGEEGNNTSTVGDNIGEVDGDEDSLDAIKEEAKSNTEKVTEDKVMEEELLETNEGNYEQEMDWAQMFQMGMDLGKSVLGEEAIEKLKKGDLSEVIKKLSESKLADEL